MAWVVPFIPYIASAVGAVYAGQQQKTAANHRADLDEQNAVLTRKQTSAAEEAQRRQMALNMGDVRAAAVESGFSPGGGSLLNLQTKTAGEMELDVLTNRYRGELEAIGLQSDAGLGRSNGRSAATSGYLSAFGSLAAGSANYMSGSKIGAYPGGMASFYGGRGRSGD